MTTGVQPVLGQDGAVLVASGVRAAPREERFGRAPNRCQREGTWAPPAGRPPLATPAQDEPFHRGDLSSSSSPGLGRDSPPPCVGSLGSMGPRRLGSGPVRPPRPSVYAENRGAEAVWGSALDTATHACPLRPPQQACLTGLCRRRFTVHCVPGLPGPGTLSVGDSDALPENLAVSRFSVLWGHRCKRLILRVTFRREECFARNIKNHH